MITRFSSRRERLDRSFLLPKLVGARGYDRIAGYFTSSILEVGGEAIDQMAEGAVVRVVCNSDLRARDVATARLAQVALGREWSASHPERLGDSAKPRFQRLHSLLSSGRLQVRVLPQERFGLVHGKAGVITLADGTKTAFLGSMNETREGWQVHYELLWEDDSSEAIAWVQEEFDALWRHADAVPLGEVVLQDIERLSRRTAIPDIPTWRQERDATVAAAAAVVEAPVYRDDVGLWEHQKYFVEIAFKRHRSRHGARLVLADQVGLGKTIQLGMVAQLIALDTEQPILILAPKTLIWQWQDELRTKLDVPSAVWNGRQWVDENEIEHAAIGPDGIVRCPRRIGIVSYGLVTAESAAAGRLKELRYALVIVDEAHRARRKNLGPGREGEAADANNLLRFLHDVAPRARSMILATATPVQLYPVEAWDLLNVLAAGNDAVLGDVFSMWRKPGEALPVVLGDRRIPADPTGAWPWIRNPLPPPEEDRDIELLRRRLGLAADDVVGPAGVDDRLPLPDQERVRRLAVDFGVRLNPFIRNIVRRSRDYLEKTVDPETGEPYLKPIRVELLGEDPAEALDLPPYLKAAYEHAEEFCRLLGRRMQSSGFLRTLLLRRVGSTIEAGRITAERLLGSWEPIEEDEHDEPDEALADQARTLTGAERQALRAFLQQLEANRANDPKVDRVAELLVRERWMDEGCIVFSQYYDSILWLARHLTNVLGSAPIGMYAGGTRTGVWRAGVFERRDRDALKEMVWIGEVRVLLGTDAASEGLNLQRLGTLINLDLPWNPTKLEQRKGRIQRIGQVRDVVRVYNMRYRDSVEDRVHDLLSERLEGVFQLFGQLPDVLEDVWIQVAQGEVERAKRTIEGVPRQHPFALRYHERVQKARWETCARVLDGADRKRFLSQGWK